MVACILSNEFLAFCGHVFVILYANFFVVFHPYQLLKLQKIFKPFKKGKRWKFCKCL